MDALTDAGCFRMLVPRSHGGAELDLPAQMRVIEELARADGSVGWTVMIGGIAPGASTRDRCAATGRGSIVALGDHRAVVPDLVGMTYVAELVTHPGQPISALALAGGGGGGSGQVSHEVIDHRARDAYVARARELMDDLAVAEAQNDLPRTERLRIELDAVVEQVEAATGLGGRPRAFTNDHERARTAVRKAIKRAIDEIDAADPTIGEVLRTSIVTGSVCMYTPTSSPRNVEWTVSRSVDASTSAGVRG